MNNNSYMSKRVGTRSVTLLLTLALVMLGVGFGPALTTTALGAGLDQQASGDISGVATLGSQPASGINVELRQRTNAGADTSLASTSTGDGGIYHFKGEPSAPGDAFYYLRFTGGKGTLSAWYTFPIIYVSGSNITVPTVELGDVQLVAPADGATLKLPGTISWSARKSGETYRLFVYAAGKTDKPALDSGNLGAGTQFVVSDGALPDGSYEAVVQVRDTVAGYGQSQAHFRFTVDSSGGSATGNSGSSVAPTNGNSGDSNNSSNASTGQGATGGSQSSGGASVPAPNPTAASGSVQLPQEAKSPDLQVHLSGDKLSVAPGGTILYKIEVANVGEVPASGVVITDKLPQGVTAVTSGMNSSAGSVVAGGNMITAQVGDIAPGTKVTVQVPVTVTADAGSNVSNQVSVRRKDATQAVQSNAFISQVEAQQSAGEQQSSGESPSNSGASGTDDSQQPASQPTTAPAQQQPTAGPAPAQATQAPANKPVVQPAGGSQSQPQSQADKTSGGQSVPKKVVPKAGQQSAAQQSSQQAQQQAAKQAPQQKPAQTMPQTGGSFPVFFALALVVVTLLARYLRGRRYRRV